MKGILIKELVAGQLTYPNWTSSKEYSIHCSLKENNTCEVFYITSQNRKISRSFPQSIPLSPKFLFVLGLIKGEGANALGKSNYRRFTFTNSDFKVVDMVLKELLKIRLVSRESFGANCFHLHHYSLKDSEAVTYWSRKLEFPKGCFKCYRDKATSSYGVCHLYLNDVLLRRVVDLLIERIMG